VYCNSTPSGLDAATADAAAARLHEHIDAALKNIDINVQYVEHAIAKVKSRRS